MSKEIEKITGKNTGKNPYTLRKLVNRWVLVLFLLLFVVPVWTELLERVVLIKSFGTLILYFIGTLTFFGMMGYTIIFLLRKKRFVEQEKKDTLNHKDENSKRYSFRLSSSTSWEAKIATIGLIALIVGVVFTMRIPPIPPGLSVIGTMFWNGKSAETVSVILCPAGTVPGLSYPFFSIGCDEKLAPRTIIDASGRYRFFNIPSGKYTIFYKWPDEDDWNLGEPIKGSFLVFVEKGNIAKVDPIPASRKDWLIEPEEILDYSSVISVANQEVVFRWKSLKDAEYYFIGIFDESGAEHPGETIFSDTVTDPVIKVLLPEGKLSLGIRVYNLKKEIIAKGWYFFGVE